MLRNARTHTGSFACNARALPFCLSGRTTRSCTSSSPIMCAGSPFVRSDRCVVYVCAVVGYGISFLRSILRSLRSCVRSTERYAIAVPVVFLRARLYSRIRFFVVHMRPSIRIHPRRSWSCRALFAQMLCQVSSVPDCQCARGACRPQRCRQGPGKGVRRWTSCHRRLTPPPQPSRF